LSRDGDELGFLERSGDFGAVGTTITLFLRLPGDPGWKNPPDDRAGIVMRSGRSSTPRELDS
jgi:hypothetical protein